jgi:succinate-semialdehyde dehydrogenase/glutarate-semialdehyde dehydrogenase
MTSRREHSTLKSTDPSTGQIFAEYPVLEPQEIFRGMRQAADAFDAWSSSSFVDRAKKMKRAAQVLRKKESEHAALISKEMGKPVKQSKAEVLKCASTCDYFADNAEKFLKSETLESDGSRSSIAYEPLGAILAVMPWNFPFWQVFRFAAPTLMAGNVAVLKHASNVPGCSRAIEEVFAEAGFPDGVFQSMLVRASNVNDLIKHPVIKAVSLTGSERAGRMVASEAGSSLKKCVLELGGSDPFIVLDDANVDEAVDGAVLGRTQNAGQSCIAAKRFIVTRKVSKTFMEKFVDKMGALVIGNPLDEETEIGPLARQDLVDDLSAMVHASVDRGAVILCGGRKLDRSGYVPDSTLHSGFLLCGVEADHRSGWRAPSNERRTET